MYPIASVVLNSNNTLGVSNIPQTYTHLQLRVFLQGTASSSPIQTALNFNNDSTIGDYYQGGHYILGNGSSATSSTAFGYNSNAGSYGFMSGSNNTNIFSSFIIDILDYANTNKYKTARAIGGYDANGSGDVVLSSFLWSSTAAITSLQMSCNTSPYTFSAGSTFQLYGITSSNVGTF